MPGIEIIIPEKGVYKDPKTGWSAYPFISGVDKSNMDIAGIHVVAILPGQVRGNHLHKDTNELLFFFSGKGVFYWEEDGELVERALDGGQALIRIPAGIKHAFKNSGEEVVYLLAVRDGAFDPDRPDVEPHRLVEG